MQEKTSQNRIGLFAAIAAALLIIHYVLKLDFFMRWDAVLPFLSEFTMGMFLVALILLIARITRRFIIARAPTVGDRYNLLRVMRLITVSALLVVAITFIFQKPYASLVSIGLVSLVLGFALQAPITSFIAWLYIVFRRPYQVGHRVQVGEIRGDVVEISYLDTVLEEVSGDYLGNDRLSGRTVHFPNSMILRGKVINYSGPQSPFIWNETALQIAYTSDLAFVEECLMQAATDDFLERYPKRNPELRSHRATVYFRNNAYAWMEAVVSYPVEPTDTTGRRNRILRRALPKLNAVPGRVQFPEGAKR